MNEVSVGVVHFYLHLASNQIPVSTRAVPATTQAVNGSPRIRIPMTIVDSVLAKNQDALAQYRAGKTATFGFLVGQVMKAAGGKANPKRVNELLKRALGA